MAIILDKDNDVVTYENQPEQARPMFPNLCDCQDLAAQVEILKDDIADLKENIANKTDYIYDTAQGAVASFSDGADDAPIKSLLANIDPVQNLHGYDAPWPAGGGVNKLPTPDDETKTLNGITVKVKDGVYTVTGTATQTADIFFKLSESVDLSPSTNKISFLNNASDNGVTVRFRRSDITVHWWSMTSINRVVANWTDSGNDVIDTVVISVNSGVTVNMTISPMLIALTETDPTEFKPYSNICPITGRSRVILTHSGAKTIIVIWETEAGAVYGGTIDVITGVLIVDRASYTWSSGGQLTSTGAFQLPKSDAITINTTNQSTLLGAVCDKLPSGTWEQISNRNAAVSRAGCAWGNSLAFRIVGYMTAEEYLTFLANNPLQFVYLLKNPQTYQLTPREVKTLLGVNNISANTGNVSVTYPCDLKLYIDKKIAEVE